MGACCGKMIVVRGGGMSRGGDYETASRDQVLRATEGRIQQQENRGVSSRGAALLKAKATEKHDDGVEGGRADGEEGLGVRLELNATQTSSNTHMDQIDYKGPACARSIAGARPRALGVSSVTTCAC